jgi:TRAP-type C4-dicarboxylate transport system permease small subunit
MGALLLGAMACLAFANVVTRYVLQYPLAFTEELEVNALVWLTMFGTSAAFRRRHHLRLLFFQEKFSPVVQKYLQVSMGLLAAALFGWLGWFGYQQLLDERLLEITSESLNLPQWWYTVCIPVGCAMIISRILVTVVEDIRGKW